MALCAKLLSFLFLLSLLFTHQAHARDSQFFSKVTTTPTTNTNNNNNNVKETEVLPKKDNTLNNKDQEQEQEQEQEPDFNPETLNGYGLYGHESGQFPPSTTTTTTINNNNNNVPYTAELEKEQQHTNNYPDRYHTTQYNPNRNNFYYNGNNNYQSNPSDTRLAQSSYTAAKTAATTATPAYYNQNGNNYNVERQGMSDTRFLENGKYYHDIGSSENNYKQNFNQQYNPNQYENSRVVDSKNWYNNNRGNYGNSNNNNANYHNSYNSMEGYQNQEFQENEDEFIP